MIPRSLKSVEPAAHQVSSASDGHEDTAVRGGGGGDISPAVISLGPITLFSTPLTLCWQGSVSTAMRGFQNGYFIVFWDI